MPADASAAFIGVDLGGSGFRVRRLRRSSGSGRDPLALETADEGEAHEQRWPATGFAPVALDVQLAAPGDRPTPEERREADARLDQVAAGVIEAREVGWRREKVRALRVALAAPGAKSADGRGIEAARHGPRVLDLVGGLARRLARGGCDLQVAAKLAGDGVAAARGEQVAPGGALRGVERALYLGGGTGVSEALVLDGCVHALDELDPPWPRAWELAGPGGASFEELLAPARAMGDFAEHLGLLVARRSSDMRALRPRVEPLFQRIVLGQAFAFLPPAFLAESARARLGPGLVVSELRAAPALGAVALAFDREHHYGRDAWVMG